MLDYKWILSKSYLRSIPCLDNHSMKWSHCLLLQIKTCMCKMHCLVPHLVRTPSKVCS